MIQSPHTTTVTFLLPHAANKPVGGYKVVYEYANRLAEQGYQINIVYGIASRPIKNKIVHILYRCIRTLRWLKFRFWADYTPASWFQTNPKINHILRYDFSKKHMPHSDYYIATAWSTAPWLNQYPELSTQHKLYLIQSFENWDTSDDEIIATWKLPLTKIVIAPWLLEIAQKLGEKAYLIENGFDMERFRMTTPPTQKNPYKLIMLWHNHPLKGCQEGLQAIIQAHSTHPQIEASFFGVPQRPQNLPSWIQYYCQPKPEVLNQLYNDAAIYVGPSHIEGFALTPAEAMLCGCAVCVTDIGGYTVICHHNDTALLSPVGDTQQLAANICRLIENPNLRIKLAETAFQNIRQYTWDRAFQKFIKLLQ